MKFTNKNTNFIDHIHTTCSITEPFVLHFHSMVASFAGTLLCKDVELKTTQQ